MMTREEKNKGIVDEIRREETIKISKKIFKYLGIIIILFSLIFLYIYFLGVKGLITNEYIIHNSSIPDSFRGVKILHFSDLLYGKTIKSDDLERISKEIKKINPQIVFFTGDIIHKDYSLEEKDIQRINAFFKDIPYTIGKYAVKGELDTTSFDLIMDNTNFTILNNEIVNVYNNTTQKINIIGININEEKEIKNQFDTFTISLIHNYDNYQKYQVQANVVLAGHNLGGEIRLFNTPLLGNNKYNNSYYEEKEAIIYISNGLGSINHMRLFNKPSINVYRLYQK